MAETRWGILGTGRIARQFAADLVLTPGQRLVAVGSRSLASAQAFTTTYGGTPYGSYDELVADDTVDVVYVASPHALHLEHGLLALEAGRHVLCEKPLTLNAADGEELIATAVRHDRFLMEAMWTACHPVIRALRDRLAAGDFGTPRHLHAELGFVVTDAAPARLLDPSLGASALLDMGIYPLTFAQLLLGPPESLTAQARLDVTESFDLDIVMTGQYAGGALATMASSMTSWSSRAAAIATDRGRLELADFHHPTRATFTAYGAGSTNDGTTDVQIEEILGAEPVIGRGYGNEALEVSRCLQAGLRESPLVPHEQTLGVLRQLDGIRAELGIL